MRYMAIVDKNCFDKSENKNPYWVLYLKKHDLKPGDEWSPSDYIIWISYMQYSFRKQHGIEEHVCFDEMQNKEFIVYISNFEENPND